MRNAGVLVGAGLVTLLGVYLILRHVLNPLLTAARPDNDWVFIASLAGDIVASGRDLLTAGVAAFGLIVAALVAGHRVGVSSRVRLALSYAAFLVGAGLVTLLAVYLVLRYVPDHPPARSPAPARPGVIASRGVILNAILGASGFILVVLAVIGVSGGWGRLRDTHEG